MIKSRIKSKIDNFGSVEAQSSTTTNKTFWADLAANEKNWTSIDASDIRAMTKAMALNLDRTFLHDYKLNIIDDGFVGIAESFIKNQYPAFRRMNRQQLALEVNKGISGGLEGKANIANLVNPFVKDFINGAKKISLMIKPIGNTSIYERYKLVSDFNDFIEVFNVRLSN